MVNCHHLQQNAGIQCMHTILSTQFVNGCWLYYSIILRSQMTSQNSFGEVILPVNFTPVFRWLNLVILNYRRNEAKTFCTGVLTLQEKARELQKT